MNDNPLAIQNPLNDLNNIPVVHVNMDTSIEKAVNIILRSRKVFKFKECVSGLYYYEIASTDVKDSSKTNATIFPYSLLSTVTENK